MLLGNTSKVSYAAQQLVATYHILLILKLRIITVAVLKMDQFGFTGILLSSGIVYPFMF